MRIFFLALMVMASTGGYAQWKEYIIGVRGDTLNRVDMQGRRQGPWVIKVPELRGEPGYEEEGYFVNDLKEGEWRRYAPNGVKIAHENYRWGKLDGRQRYYTYNGGLLREESWRAIDPSVPYDTVPVYDINDPSKIKEWVVVKNEGVSLKHGKWIYYDPIRGNVTGTEYYVMNKLQTQGGDLIAEDDIKPLSTVIVKQNSDSSSVKKVKKPQAVLDWEKKNSGKKKIKVRDGTTGY
ncbi:MAG: hypothetical protein N2747_00765 [Chitinophagaceae bacterium]|nr:hypothetical protein [Chitinophagaceae bacterium]